MPQSNLMQSSDGMIIKIPNNYHLHVIRSWGVSCSERRVNPFPIFHTLESKGGEIKGVIARIATSVRKGKLQNQWHFQKEEQRLHSQARSLLLLTGREMRPNTDYQVQM